MQITNEDCMELMARYEDNHFELAIVDPPYGIGRDKQEKIICKIANHNRKYFNELFRISVNQIIWGGNYFSMYLPSSMGWIFWYKGQQGLTMSDGEIAFSSFNKATRLININRGFISENGLLIKGSIHPTQKPVKLYEWLLMNYAKEGDKILDTHLGSGSIAIACHNLGYNLTACEIDEEYYNDAIKRLKQHTSQKRLF